MNKEFDNWWNSDELLKDNPYRKDSPAYWAWEGWCAAVKAEREACAKVCEDDKTQAMEWTGTSRPGGHFAAAIRARGQDPMPLFDDWGKDWK